MEVYNSLLSIFTELGVESSLIPDLSLVVTAILFSLGLLAVYISIIYLAVGIPYCFRTTLFIRTENGYHLRYGFPFKCGAQRYAQRYNKKHLNNNILYIVAVNDKNYLNTLCTLPDDFYIDDLKCLYRDSRLCFIYNVRTIK